MTAPSGEFSVDVLKVHQQPQLSQIWPPGVFLDPRLRGDDVLAREQARRVPLRHPREGGDPESRSPTRNILYRSHLLWDTHPNPWNKAARILGAIGQKWRIFNVRVQTHVRLLGSPVSGRSLAGEAWPRPYRRPSAEPIALAGEAWPRPYRRPNVEPIA